MKEFDVIVIGGGHAGVEAAMASSRMGHATLLITQNIETIGQMSCNPAIGGIGKTHLVKEIDALGGIMGQAADYSCIQARTINSKKGPAVRANRIQSDRTLYRNFIRKSVESQPNLYLFQQEVESLIINHYKIEGIHAKTGLSFFAKKIILTAGTFLAGKIHMGKSNYSAGRAGDSASIPLAKQIFDLDFKVERLKTGTPPRLAKNTINFAGLEKQESDNPRTAMSLWLDSSVHPQQLPCHITYTNEKTHQIVQDNLKNSSMYGGQIEGVGPRYCPSIEDKIVKFADKNRHQVFIEPEGIHSNEVYPNGISNSLPFEVQQEFIHSILGFENAHIVRAGYAIEYDFFQPTQLQPSLETKQIEGLYFAGQINGTTGYEEAAAQGLLAAINACLAIEEKEQWLPKRSESYIGVMVDDLITNGTNEPYRMFTSRAEYRLLLREDNAFMRLSDDAFKLGLLCQSQKKYVDFLTQSTKKITHNLKEQKLKINSNSHNQLLDLYPDLKINESVSFDKILKQAQVQLKDIMPHMTYTDEYNDVILSVVENDIKYDGYIQRQLSEINRTQRVDLEKIPSEIDFKKIPGLSNEAIQKLTEHRPLTLGNARRIEGITPAAISILQVCIKKLLAKTIPQ